MYFVVWVLKNFCVTSKQTGKFMRFSKPLNFCSTGWGTTNYNILHIYTFVPAYLFVSNSVHIGRKWTFNGPGNCYTVMAKSAKMFEVIFHKIGKFSWLLSHTKFKLNKNPLFSHSVCWSPFGTFVANYLWASLFCKHHRISFNFFKAFACVTN